MASSYPMKKNTSVKIVFPILDADGDLVSGAAALDSEYSLDGGAFSDCTNEATEIGSDGIYHLTLTAGETNGDVVCVQVKTTTSGAKTTVLVFYTSAQTLDELDTVCDGIKAKTDSLNFTSSNVHAHIKAEDNIDFGATKKASINTEVDTALSDLDLDHLIQVTAGAEEPTDGSYLDQMMHKNVSQTFDPTTDSLEAIRDNQAGADAAAIADAVWDEAIADHTTGTTFGGKNQKVVPSETINDYKATGFSTHAAADVWTVGTRALTDKAGFSLAADQSGVTFGTVNTVGDKTGYALSAAGIDAIIDDVVEGTLTMRQAIRIFLSALAGKSTGGGTTTITFRDKADSKARITATVDADGNRTDMTLDGT